MARPLPDLVLFLDECLGVTDVPTALRTAGITCELLHDHFAAGTADQDWLAAIAARGWVVLTKDQRIRRRQAELQALITAKVAAFVLTSGDLTGAAMGAAFVLAYPRMQKLLRDYEPPFVAAVDSSGKVKLVTAATKRAAKKREP
ncbi:MAG: hypothetical protein K8J09_02790 [Planctomycetes bacterium]|nr:hypothetical protein [Planctomycetota bacterium]MCC7397908.1 hypothetical protein [Planctomycetota bacterium]